jgi:hypothetical protein
MIPESYYAIATGCLGSPLRLRVQQYNSSELHVTFAKQFCNTLELLLANDDVTRCRRLRAAGGVTVWQGERQVVGHKIGQMEE